MAITDIPAFIRVADGPDAEGLARALRTVTAVERFALDGGAALEDACLRWPGAFVVLDGADPTAAASCRRLRALEGGALTTVIVLGADEPGREPEHATLLAAGADAVWPRDVAEAVVVDAFRRVRTRRSAFSATDDGVVSAIIDSAPDAVFLLSSDGVIRSANVGVQAMLGYPPSALFDRTLRELVNDEDAHLLCDLESPAVVRLRRHDGTFIEAELSARSMTDDPAIGGVLVTARDASERISVGAALLESETRFAAIFENLLDGLAQVDEETGRLVQVNPAFCRITGYTPEEASRLTFLDLFPTEDRARSKEIVDAHFRGERSVSEALSILHKERVPLYVDLGTTRMELSGVRLVLCVLRDVTARRETERTREVFLGVVAHELRTPVAVLQHSVELLRANRAPSPTDHEVIVDVMDEEVQRLVRLVADAVDLGALQAGTFVVSPARVELAPLVTAVVDQLAPQFGGRASLNLEAVDALVDPVRFAQVVTKLVDNAWRHGGAPDIEVSLTAVDGSARLDIVDHGPGLPLELERTVFRRSLLPSERPTSGIGIGLWLCHRLVRAMGGTIEARPRREGGGLHVTVRLPRVEDATRTA